MLGLRDEERIQELWLNSSRALQRGLGQFCWCERHVGGVEVLALDGESNGEDVKMGTNPGGTLVWAAGFSLLVVVVVIAILLVKREKSCKYLGLSPRHWLALKNGPKTIFTRTCLSCQVLGWPKKFIWVFLLWLLEKLQTNTALWNSLLILISLWPWAHAEVLCSRRWLKQSVNDWQRTQQEREE